METTLKIPLKEQENLRELFRLLEERGMQAEKGQVMDLADYIDSMDAQFEKVLSELQTVKRQLKVIEQRGIRQTLLRTVGTLEVKVGAAKAELIDLKNQFLDGVSRTLTGFRKRGVLAIYQTIDFLGIRRGLLGVKRHLRQSLETADRGIISLGNIGDEMYGVKTHLGNIKRELSGKEPLETGSREMEKGAVYQVQKMLYGTIGVLDHMEKQTDRTIRRLDCLGERAEEIRHPSVREDLKAIRIGRQSDRGKQIQPLHRRARATAR